jgi:hypothetical protein
MERPQELHAGSQLADRSWRLNNLYTITGKTGQKIRFTPNWAQQEFLNKIHECSLILKARQLGFTTLVQILMLDACLFNSNIRAGTIAHRLDDARTIFRDKVRCVYDDLPEVLKVAIPIIKDSVDELVFANNSSIRVSTSMRSGIAAISSYLGVRSALRPVPRQSARGQDRRVKYNSGWPDCFHRIDCRRPRGSLLRSLRAGSDQAAHGHAADAA